MMDVGRCETADSATMSVVIKKSVWRNGRHSMMEQTVDCDTLDLEGEETAAVFECKLLIAKRVRAGALARCGVCMFAPLLHSQPSDEYMRCGTERGTDRGLALTPTVCSAPPRAWPHCSTTSCSS